MSATAQWVRDLAREGAAALGAHLDRKVWPGPPSLPVLRWVLRTLDGQVLVLEFGA